MFVSTIERRSVDAMTSAPLRLASTGGGPIAAQPERDGTIRPLSTSYQAVARLDDTGKMLRNGLTGRARVETTKRTLWWRLVRYFSRTFNFKL